MKVEREKQHARLARLVKELLPHAKVSGASKGMQGCIYAMRVNDTRTGDILFTSPDGCYLTVDQIKDKTDEEIKKLLLEWMNAFKRKVG